MRTYTSTAKQATRARECNGVEVHEVAIADAIILPGQWRNFAGRQTKYKPAGTRSFTLALDPELADNLAAEQYNVKQTKPRDDYEQLLYLEVGVKYGYKPPKIKVFDGVETIELDEETVCMLDWAEVDRAEVTLNPYIYDRMTGGGQAVKAYLKSANIYLKPDPFYEVHNPNDNS